MGEVARRLTTFDTSAAARRRAASQYRLRRLWRSPSSRRACR